jgi:hypothetical protein
VTGTSDAERILLGSVTEGELQTYVLRTARLLGYRCYHTTYSIKSQAGFPDLVLVGRIRRRTVFAELKRQGLWPTRGRVNRQGRWVDGQAEWLSDLLSAGSEAYLWWPSDRQAIARILQDGAAPDEPCVARLREYLAAEEALRDLAP